MHNRPNLYHSVKQQREIERKVFQRVFLSGYFNQEEVKRDNLNTEQYLKDSFKGFPQVSSYIYIKGVFYVQLLESQSIVHINRYLSHFKEELADRPALVNKIAIVHQSYQNTKSYFKGISCDNNPQPGPILGDTEKTDEQIQDRSFEIYELFMDGARMKAENPSHKIGNMIVLSNDDMSILNGYKFMSLDEYLKIYVGEMELQKEQESNYPLPPSFFDIMEFLEVDKYQNFMKH